MAFLSQRDTRTREQALLKAPPMEPLPEASSDYDVFGAQVGLIIDEGLSISSLLNNEGRNQRKRQVKELGDSDQFNIADYTRDYGVLDYDRLSNDFPDFGIKTDRQLHDEKVEVLRKRREYADDVIKRGSGMAQFLGYGAYMLDPINIATLPIATAGASLKGLSVIARAMTVAGREAGLATAAELMIQPLVYQYKHDIESPYEFSDALTAIVASATGAAAIGGLVGGISGYFSKVRRTAEGQPLDDDAIASLEILARMEEQLNSNPARKLIDFESVENAFIVDLKARLLGDSSQKLTRGERKALTADLRSLEHRLNSVTEDIIQPQKAKGVPARKAKADAKAQAGRLADSERADIVTQIDAIKTRLGADEAVSIAEANLTKLDQGIIPDQFKKELDKIKSDLEIETDAEFMRRMNTQAETMNPPSKEYDNYTVEERSPAAIGTASQREREVLTRQGIEKDYDQDMAAYNALDNPKIVQHGELVDAGDFMKGMDDEISGLDGVLRCAIV